MRRLASILLSFCFLLPSCRPDAETNSLSGAAMGTTWKLAWRGDTSRDMNGEVARTMEKWESVLSQWREDSDLSRFNRGEPATPELQRVINLAEEIRMASGGAFDHRLLRQVGEAGFGPGGDGIDLSAIGKGFAVDRVGERLREMGVTDFVFELGGEILAGEGNWKVAIEKPDPAVSVTGLTVTLNNQALATSGNYRQFRPVGGGLESHILDPATGKPVIRPFSSVSVIAKDCTTADAWATALFVLGPGHAAPDGMEVIWDGKR